MSLVTDGYKELTLDQGQASKVIIFGMVQFLIMYFFVSQNPFFYRTKQHLLISVT